MERLCDLRGHRPVVECPPCQRRGTDDRTRLRQRFEEHADHDDVYLRLMLSCRSHKPVDRGSRTGTVGLAVLRSASTATTGARACPRGPGRDARAVARVENSTRTIRSVKSEVLLPPAGGGMAAAHVLHAMRPVVHADGFDVRSCRSAHGDRWRQRQGRRGSGDTESGPDHDNRGTADGLEHGGFLIVRHRIMLADRPTLT